MNTYLDGKAFEKEAFEYLKSKFDDVKWISRETNNSTSDFICSKDKKILICDAKVGKNKPVCNSRQYNETDFLCFKDKNTNQFRLIYKKDYPNEVTLTKLELIKIFSTTKIELDSLKEHPRETYDDVISKLIKNNK